MTCVDMPQPLHGNTAHSGAGQPAANTAGRAMYADGIAYSNQPILAGPGESQTAVGAEAARVDAILASTVAVSGESTLTGTHHKGQLQIPQQQGQLAEPSPESSPLPSPGSKAPQGFAGFHHGVHAPHSPTVQNLWPTSVGPSSPQGQHPPQSAPFFGYSVQQEMETPTSHADTANTQLPSPALDAGHVASGPAPGVSRPSALDQLYALAQGSGSGGQQEGTVATAVAASPAVSASVGQSLDLNKVRASPMHMNACQWVCFLSRYAHCVDDLSAVCLKVGCCQLHALVRTAQIFWKVLSSSMMCRHPSQSVRCANLLTSCATSAPRPHQKASLLKATATDGTPLCLPQLLTAQVLTRQLLAARLLVTLPLLTPAGQQF